MESNNKIYLKLEKNFKIDLFLFVSLYIGTPMWVLTLGSLLYFLDGNMVANVFVLLILFPPAIFMLILFFLFTKKVVTSLIIDEEKITIECGPRVLRKTHVFYYHTDFRLRVEPQISLNDSRIEIFLDDSKYDPTFNFSVFQSIKVWPLTAADNVVTSTDDPILAVSYIVEHQLQIARDKFKAISK
jgi:hypothetical protein